MTAEIINLIRENIIQGRVTKDDEGLDEGMVGQPGVLELVQEALAQKVDLSDICSGSLPGSTAGVFGPARLDDR